MEMNQLRYFVAAAESGSISRAARRCGVTQPSLSQQIRRLEDTLSVDLFDRIGRGIEMTDAGRALLPRARRILREVGEAEQAIGSGLVEEHARLAIGAIPTMAPFVLPALVASLRAEHPVGELLIREDLTQNLIEALVDCEIDVAILSTPLNHELVDVETIAREPMLVVVPRKHPFHRLQAVRGADLRDEPAVTLHEMHCLGQQIAEFCVARRINRPIVCRTTQLSTVLEMVRRGLGVSIVPEMAAKHDSGEGLAFLPITPHRPHREIAIAWRSGRSRSQLGTRMRDLLIDQLR